MLEPHHRRFADRADAGHALAAALVEWRRRRPFAIPRGAVPMAAIIATALGGKVDVIDAETAR